MSDVSDLILSTAAAYGLDPRLALEVAIQESNLDQSRVSSAGAIGIFQLMPATAAALGVDPIDTAQNIQGGCMYLAQLLSQFGGDVRQALAAYNWGPTNLSKAIAAYGPAGWINHAPAETQNYVATILGNMGSQYSVSVGTPAAPASAGVANPPFNSTAVNEASVIPSNLSTGEILWIAGIGLAGIFLVGLLQE